MIEENDVLLQPTLWVEGLQAENKKNKKIITLGSCSLYNTLDIEAALFLVS